MAILPILVFGPMVMACVCYLIGRRSKLWRDVAVGLTGAAAFALCAENQLPMVRVFGLDDPQNLIKVLEGSDIGTFVHP